MIGEKIVEEDNIGLEKSITYINKEEKSDKNLSIKCDKRIMKINA